MVQILTGEVVRIGYVIEYRAFYTFAAAVLGIFEQGEVPQFDRQSKLLKFTPQ